MDNLTTAALVIAGIINLMPLTGVVSGRHLLALYGLPIDDPSLLVLLRHRAVLLGIVGGLLLAAAAVPSLRAAALSAGLISMVSFVVLQRASDNKNPKLRRVMVIDVAASAPLVIAAVAHAL